MLLTPGPKVPHSDEEKSDGVGVRTAERNANREAPCPKTTSHWKTLSAWLTARPKLKTADEELHQQKDRRDFLWMLISLYGRIVLQAFAFLLLARALEAGGYGAISGITALVAISVPFSGAGGSSLALKHGARNHSVAREWISKGFLLLILTMPPLALIVYTTTMVTMGKHFDQTILWCIFYSEVVALRIPDIGALTFQAIDRLDLSAKVNLMMGAFRLLATLIVFAIPVTRNAQSYALVYASTSTASAIVMLISLRKHFGPLIGTTPSRKELFAALAEGLPFSLGIASKTVYGDLDKAMLARLATAQITGIYSAAYRIVNMAFVPAQSLIASITVKLLQSAQHGAQSTIKTAARIYPLLIAYSAFTGVALWLLAPIAAPILGPTYTFIGDVVKALAWMPVIQVTHFLVGDILMALDRQGPRSVCQVLTAVINAALNLVLIPRMSWRGAVIASYASEGFLALALGFLVYLALKKTSPSVSKL